MWSEGKCMSEQTCPECHGTGIVWDTESQEHDCCKSCDGSGTVSRMVGSEKLTREELNHENTK